MMEFVLPLQRENKKVIKIMRREIIAMTKVRDDQVIRKGKM